MMREISKTFNILRRSEKPKVLLCTPEVTELPGSMGNAAHFIQAKTGGLADISAALVEQLNENSDFEFHVVLPKYDRSIKGLGEISSSEIHKLKTVLKDSNIHLIDHPSFTETFADGSKVDVYGDTEIHSSLKKAMAYQSGVVNYTLDDINPDVVHCNDWMTGLIPAATRERGIKSLFTLHNIFTKNMSPAEIFREGLNSKQLNGNLYLEKHPNSLENSFYDNKVDFTTTGIFSSDYFNTVSPTYLEELVRGEFSDIVPPQMREQIINMYNAGRAVGIVNAPREKESPMNSGAIIPYDTSNFSEIKPENKKEFQKRMGLKQDPNLPLYLWPHRLSEQKGIQELMPQIQNLVSKYGVQMAFVADGKEDFKSGLTGISLSSNGMVSYSGFDKNLEELGMAGSDFLLMPSRYEPCGLPQMKSKRFGTIPVVRNTGGLADTVKQLDPYNNTGSGFLFDVLDKQGFEYAIGSSLKDFYTLEPKLKEKNLERIMKEGFESHNLKDTAQEYIKIYEKLFSESKNL